MATETAVRHLNPVPDADNAPPRSDRPEVAAEQITLGAMLINAATIPAITDIVGGDDFHHPRHTAVYDAIVAAHTAGVPTEPVALATWLLNNGDNLDRVGGAPYLHTLIAAVPTTANATHYASIVAEHAERRRLTTAVTRITQAAASPGRTAEELADFAEATIRAARPAPRTTDLVRIGDLVADGIQEIEERGKRKPGQLVGIPTGLSDLDRLTGGLQRGHLVVVAGRPGMGKSTLAADIARATAIEHGNPALFVSLEMTKEELFQRILSAEASVPLHVIREGRLDEQDWMKVGKTGGRLADAPLFITDTRDQPVTRIANTARKVQSQHGLALVVVDYLQYVKAARRGANREAEVAEIARQLKSLAGELGVPVIAVAQCGRGPESRNDKRPMLSDLRESGEIENAADLVALLYRDDYYHRDSPQAGEVEINIAKNRHGPQDLIVAAAQLHLSRFYDMAIATPPPGAYTDDPEEH